MFMNRRFVFSALFALAMFFSASFATQTSAQIVINEVYGGGGNSGATLRQDFIELYNAGTTNVDLTGYSIQYGSATGSSFTACTLTGADLIVEPQTYFLIGAALGAGGSQNLPTIDADCSILALGGTTGKVALVSNTTAISGCPAIGAAGVVDFVGYGTTANCFEGTGPTPAPSNTNSVQRIPNGTDTNNNATNFLANTPTPRALNVSPTAAGATISGRVLYNGKGIPKAKLILTDTQGNAFEAATDRRGNFSFTDVPTGTTYVLTVKARGFNFDEPTKVILLSEDANDINFNAY